ncbi:MAG: hypothetical protein FJX62_01365 [Alphaproteobacteria bacterium]|nr:hypothetical protein [Alphaproteobacteria bacterium]
MRIRTSKLLLAAAAATVGLAMTAAVPAEAQSSEGKKRVAAKQAKVAKAQPRRSAQVRHRGANLVRPGPLYNGPDYLGDDPDPHIRFELMRELSARYGGVD